jgi:hypothetical protein
MGCVEADSLARWATQSMLHQPDNFAAGTQVVSRVEICGPTASLLSIRLKTNQN